MNTLDSSLLIKPLSSRSTEVQDVNIPTSQSYSKESENVPVEEMEKALSRVVEALGHTLNSNTVVFCWHIPIKQKFRVLCSTKLSSKLTSKAYIDIGDKDILSQTVRKKKILLYPYVNHKTLPNFTPYYSKLVPIRSAISSPVFYKNSIRAVLVADSTKSDYFSEADGTLLWHYSEICTSILDLYLHESEQRISPNFSSVSSEYFHKLYKHSNDFNLCLADFFDGFCRSMEFDTLTLATLDKSSKLVIKKSVYNDGSEYLQKDQHISLDKSAMGDSFRYSISGIIDKLSQLKNKPRFYPGEPVNSNQNASMALIPLNVDKKTIGVVGVEYRKPGSFKDEIFFKARFFVETLALAAQSSHYTTIAKSAQNQKGHQQFIVSYEEYKVNLLKEFNRSVRNNTSVGILVIGIDNLEKIAKDYGNQVAHKVLDSLKYFINNKTRSYDIKGTLSENSFVVSLCQTEQSSLNLWAEKTRTNLSSIKIAINKFDTITFTVSIGASIFSSDTKKKSIFDVLENAITAFDKAKSNGGNKVKYI